uniref:Cytochrome c oxidase subunit 4 n=1 Tax=Trichuris muris TaxID=70415 RepID=A0A5S6QQR5_TRIMR
MNFIRQRPAIANVTRLVIRKIQTNGSLRSDVHGDVWYGPERAAGREIVGYGFGNLEYFDRLDHPYPALRFRKEDDTIRSLRIKEKGDWSLLSVEEKHALYRASFRMSFAEMVAPSGHWKVVAGFTMILITLGLWFVAFLKTFIFGPLPPSFSDESKELQLQRMIDTYSEPITGYASKWDYEKNQWKA